ncbi:MAG: lipopolysaccharide biosynthesis protein RfbH, partial [Opitutaceae bacterium]
MNPSLAELRSEILRLTRQYARRAHAAHRPGDDSARPAFQPDHDIVPYAGRVFAEEEVEAAVDSTLDFWLTLGKEGAAFERELADFLGVHASLLVNSGSSANLIALSALTTPKLPAHRRLLPGDEVITAAAGFPTTVAPIVQCGAVPVFVDNDPATGNVRAERLEAAFRSGRTKAVIIAHTLGNPFDLDAVLGFCRRHDLWLIEDNCDALGSTYAMPLARARALGLNHLLARAEKGTGAAAPDRLPAVIDGRLVAYTGSWGDLSTQSFYPPHHLTTGEGGAVNIVSQPPLKRYAESFRDWGRDCWCASGKDDTCGKRFGWRLGELPPGYDHKYIYTHFGYNLKPLDLQAAIGRVQLKRLPAFVEARRKNWDYLRRGLADLEEYFEFTLPTHATGWSPAGFEWDGAGRRAGCSWFGFMLMVRGGAPFTRVEFARHL